MPAKSKQQQKFFGVVKAMQKGDIPKKGEAGEVADDMDKKEIDKMASTKHKGLPKKIKEMIEEELQTLTEVKPFVDNKLRSKWDYPKGNRDGLVYLATNDKRYPTEIVLYNQKRDVFHFVYSHSGEFTAGNTKTQTVPRKGFNSTHYVMPYFEEWEEDLGYERGFYEGKVNEGTDKKLDKLFQASKLADIRMGEDGLYKLAMAWEEWNTDNDDQYDELIDPLFAAVEMVQDDTSAGKAKATRMLKQFQKDAVAAMKAHQDVPDEKEMSIISKARAKAALKQIKSGKRDDGMGKFTARLFGLNSSGNWMQINDPSDLGFYRKFGLAEAKLPDEGFSDPDQMREAKMTPAKVQKAQKELVATIQLLKKNFPMYKAAKESGDEKKLAKHRKIALDLTKKKKDLELALDKALGGLYQDAELDLKEGKVKQVTKQMWDKMDDDARVNALLTAFKDPDDAEEHAESEYNDLPPVATSNMVIYEAAPRMRKDPYVEKLRLLYKDVAKLDRQMNTADRSRYSHVKRDWNKALKAIASLTNTLNRKGATIPEGKLNEMDINDPVLVAMRAFKTQLKKDKLKPKPKKISMNKYYKLMDMESDLIDQMKDAAKELAQLNSDMNAEAGQKGDNWSDADANRYGGDLDKLQSKYEKLAKQKAKVKKAITTYRMS